MLLQWGAIFHVISLFLIYVSLSVPVSYSGWKQCWNKTDQDCFKDVHRIVFIGDDIMGVRCRLSAATEESTACTNSHAIKEPTHTHKCTNTDKSPMFCFVFLFQPLVTPASFDSLFWRNVFFFFLSDWLQLFSKGLSIETGNKPDVPTIRTQIRPVSAARVTRTEHVFYAVHRLKMTSYVDLAGRLCKHT